jgi:hypothetical protein
LLKVKVIDVELHLSVRYTGGFIPLKMTSRLQPSDLRGEYTARRPVAHADLMVAVVTSF